MTDIARWQRLAESLTANDIPGVKITTFGQSHYISWRLADGSLVEVHDRWWRKNSDVWIGWQVHIEGPDSLVKREWPLTKKRSEVAADVAVALLTKRGTR